MRNQLRSYWLFGRTFTSIELTSVAGEDHFYGIQAKRKKGEFDALEQFESGQGEALADSVKKHSHCWLTINTEKVLVRHLTYNANIQKTLEQAFPAIDLNEFYYEVAVVSDQAIVSISRKDYVDSILTEFSALNLQVVGVSLGVSGIPLLQELLQTKEIQLNRYIWKDAKLITLNEFSEIIDNYSISDLEIPFTHLSALSGLFRYSSTGHEIHSNLDQLDARLLSRHSSKVFFKKGLMVGVVALLVSLLVNFFVFDHYFERYNTLNTSLSDSEGRKELLRQRQDQLLTKEQLVNDVLLAGNSRASYYLDRLMVKKPSSVVMDQLQFQPLKRTIKNDRPIQYVQQQLIVAGKTIDRPEFNLWIRTLESLAWVSKVTVTDFKSESVNRSSFRFQIDLDHEAAQ